ncbi:MAG TPA: alpha/beta fold hydrolase [Solirubrobacteraceae bacterium]|jgi:pimeloyl-ACP methyl ester carboxylesterase|nr:alpha/beta fold hydrolase [Solirubrobacteraceae bacterium]
MTLAHDRTGSGEPLILIHGFGTSRRVWEPVVPALAREREVIAIDLPGFGDSPASVDHPTPARLADAVGRFLDELGLGRAHVAGYSMGGWIALELSKAGRALSTCAVCPAGFWNRWERAYCKASLRTTRLSVRLLGRRFEAVANDPALRRAINRQSFEHADRLSPELTLALARGYAAAPGFDATLEALHEGHFTGGAAVAPPATVAWGDRDKLLLPRQAERARAALPQARHLLLPGCGHHPMVDDTEATVRAILTAA